MSPSDDAKHSVKTISSELHKLEKKIERLEKENHELKERIKELESGQSQETPDETTTFGINVDNDGPQTKPTKKAESSIPAPGSATTTRGTRDKPEEKSEIISKPTHSPSTGTEQFGPDSVNKTDLDDLLDNDALVSTVYNRLQPLESLKYRLLAMQLGISVERCKEAVDKLVAAEAVSLDDNGVVTLL